MGKNRDKRKELYRLLYDFACMDTSVKITRIKTKELDAICKQAGYSSHQSFQDTVDILTRYNAIKRVKLGVYTIDMFRMKELYEGERDIELGHDSSPETILTKLKDYVGRKFVSKKELRMFFFDHIAITCSPHYMRNVIAPYLKSGHIVVNDKGVYEITKKCLTFDEKKELPSSSPFVLNKIREKIKSAFDNHKMPLWVVAARIWRDGILTSMQFIRRTVNRILSAVPS